MKTFGIVFVLSVTTANSALWGVDISVSTGGGTIFGVANEFVYDQQVSTNYVLSQLNWSFNPIVYFGMNAHLSAPSGFFADLSADSGINARSGTMNDSDFLNGDGTRTLYSQSDNYTEYALLSRLRAGDLIPLGKFFSLGLHAELNYLSFKWSARDGYLQYPPQTGVQYSFDSTGKLVKGTEPAWSPTLPEQPVYGVGIIYQQQFLIPAVGFTANIRPTANLSIEFSASGSPILYAIAIDNHVARSLTFTDTFTTGYYLSPALDLRYSFSPRAAVTLSGSYRLITGLVGSDTVVYDGTTNTQPSVQYVAGPASSATFSRGAGAALSALSVSLQFHLQM